MNAVIFNRGRKRLGKVLLAIVLCLGLVTVYQNVFYSALIKKHSEAYKENELLSRVKFKFNNNTRQMQNHNLIINNFYETRKTWVTSNLGSMMFKNQPQVTSRSNVKYVVLIWKYFDWLKQRHIYTFNNKRYDPLDQCSVKNCKFIGNDSVINKVDAVVVHIQHGVLPKIAKRNPKQRWIFLSDESPINTFTMAKIKPNLKNWANIFNWSMTYRTDSDVPVPYGRTVALQTPLIKYDLAFDSGKWSKAIANYVPYWNYKRRDVLITVLMSNCRVTERMKYLKDLQKYIDVDVHGKCSNRKKYKYSCPGHFRSDCKVINKYLFYLVLENSKCRQYLTEKGFNNAYAKGAIPIIMGPPREDCVKLLPPNSFLHVDDFASPKDLANKITSIANRNESLLAYHRWRNNFEVRNEHGYFKWKSFHFCRVCEALNYNNESTSIYDADTLRLFLDPNVICTTNWG